MVVVYVFGTLVGIALVLAACSASYAAGVKTTAREDVRKTLRPLRLTTKDAVLYRQAAKILNRLINVTDFDGDMAADIVSAKTREQIETWISDYQKELDKV